jgi:hypothetical protein
MILIGEIVHRRPRGWWQEVDTLYELLQTFGDGTLKLAMHSAVATGDYSSGAVENWLSTATISTQGRASC